jgi:DNA-binding PadR family transcriptional regulator
MQETRKKLSIDDLLPLKPVEFLVLLVLMDGERHGYGIVRDIVERTDGRTRPLPGNLYAVLGRLMDSGLLAESSRRPAKEMDDERRRYYRITQLGRRALAADAERMKNLVGQVEAHELIKADSR